jgi:steroid delta-isomerase
MMIESLEDAHAFAKSWAAAWNRRDIEPVLEHFAENVAFTSPTALAVAGIRTVNGKEALRGYWSEALTRIGSLRFIVDRVVWDSQNRELAIIYTSEIDGTTKRVSENLTFDRAGRVVTAEVFHGVTRQP